MNNLGELQYKILDHMVDCVVESENANHISKALGLSQSTVFESIQLLKKAKYVQTEQEYSRGKQTLTLTDKGVAAVLFSGKEKDKIYSYLRQHAPSSFMLLFMNIVKDKNDLDIEWMRLFIEYMLCQEQNENAWDEKKKGELIAVLIAGPMNSFVDAKKLRSNLERYEIFLLIEMLRNKIESTNSIIDQLTTDELNQDKFKPEISSQKWRQSISKQHKDKLKRAITRTKTGVFNSSADIRNDTDKEMVFDFRAKAFYEGLINMHSDLLRLRVNKADGEMTVTPIPKST
jgi:DNA-binding MarR family transcriptional regulator